VVFAGAAEGGIWKTRDGGQTWTPLTDNQPALSIGSMAFDPSNPDTVYAGTGEANFGSDGYGGAGILKTTDGGNTWTNVVGPFVGLSISGVAVQPTNGNIILAASSGGIFRSTDAGQTWKNVLAATFGSAVLFDPVHSQIAYAGLGYIYGGSPAGIYKSSDGGMTWSQLRGSVPNALPTSNIGRVALTISPNNPSTLYAGIQSTVTGFPLSAYKTDDGGTNWTAVPGQAYCNGNCWYNNVVQFHPTNPSVLLGGGTNLFGSFDSGKTWKRLGARNNGPGVHVDFHAIAFSADGSRIYVGSDGGVWTTSDLSNDGLATWVGLNGTLSLTQLYPGLALHPTNSNIAFGGTQDNGAVRFSGDLTWSSDTCGDAGAAAFDPVNPSTVYVACSGGQIVKSSAGGIAGSFIPANSGLSAETPFIPFIAIDPSTPSHLYYAGDSHVFQTVNGAASWSPISPAIASKGGICTITVSPSDSNTVYAGTCSGGFWVTTSAIAGSGSTWTDRSLGLPNRAITSIAVDSINPKTAFIALSGFGSGHVYKTADGGASWADISGNLPDIPANAVVIDPDLPGVFYLATDIGVFWTSDGGNSWAVLGLGLPSAAVLDLELHRPSRILRAATHGRSIWDLVMPVSGLNPVPSITSLQPSLAIAGSGSLNVVVSGAGFTQGSTALVGGIPVAPTLVNSGQLKITVPASLTSTPGAINVIVSNAPPGGGASNYFVLNVGLPPAAGQWRDGQNQIVTVSQTGSALLVQYRNGTTVSGTVPTASTLQVAFSATCCSGTFSSNDDRIDWSDGTSWYRPFLGQWMDQIPEVITVSDSGSGIVARYDNGRTASGTALTDSTLNINFGANCCQGVVSVDGSQISWSNNTTWAFFPLALTAAGTVNAASFQAGAVAPDEFVSLFGTGFSLKTASASGQPLPSYLSNVTVSFLDTAGHSRPAQIAYISPTLINCVVPEGLANGVGAVTILAADGGASTAPLQLAALAPGIFTANASGNGVPAATAVRYGADGVQTPEPVFQCSSSGCIPAAIDLGQPGESTYLTLYATGLRNRSSLSDVNAQIGGIPAQVVYAGPQGSYAGLDQVNILIPQSLRGVGQVSLVLSVSGVAANTVSIAIQ
jgi:uncharacterized protein (TIGR03437 family)